MTVDNKTNSSNNNSVKSAPVKKGLKKGTLEFLLSSTGLDSFNNIKSAQKLENSDAKNTNINNSDDKVNISNTTSGSVNKNSVQTIHNIPTVAIEKIIRSPYQPRKNFEPNALEELSSSIKAKGLIQPLVVRIVADKKNPDNKQYELIAGERRWRACQLAGLHDVPVVIKDVDNETALIMAIVENIQRQDLSALEEAKGIKRLLDEFGLTQQQAAQVVGKSRTAVTNLLRLLSLNPGVQNMLDQNKLEMGHARALLSLEEEQQLKIANRIILKKASVRDAEKWVREIIAPPKPINKSKFISDPNIKSLENTLSEILNAEVIIEHTENGKGKLVINYYSIDELDGIVDKIK